MEVIEMRNLLDAFCDTKATCDECPLASPVCRCGHCTHFLNVSGDSYEMSDEEIISAFKIAYPENDPVNYPSHYTDGKIEVIDFIEDKNLGFCLGNAVKYIARAGKKDPSKEVEDLKKAAWYVARRIREIEDNLND